MEPDLQAIPSVWKSSP